jgi:hypothetical protein
MVMMIPSDSRVGLRRPASRGLWVWGGLAVVAGVAGCGDGSGAPVVAVYEVRGQVLRADGKPLGGGHIDFVSRDGAMTSEGVIGRDGTFSLATGPSGEGAPPGDYKVRVLPDDPSLLTPRRGPARGKKLPFHPRYLDEDTSGLTARVEPRANLLEPFRLR